LHFATKHSRLLDRLSANACGLYRVHYNFVVWLQYALVAMIKAAIVSAVRWITVLAVQRIPFGAPRRAVATS
jgi:hypothetical protein